MKLKYPLPLDSQTNLVEVINADSVPLTVVDSLRQACDNTSDVRAKREGELHPLTPFHHLQSDEIMALVVAAVVKQQTRLLHGRKPVQIEIANLENKYQESYNLLLLYLLLLYQFLPQYLALVTLFM